MTSVSLAIFLGGRITGTSYEPTVKRQAESVDATLAIGYFGSSLSCFRGQLHRLTGRDEFTVAAT